MEASKKIPPFIFNKQNFKNNMKEIIIKFKKLIKFSVSIFACREFGFVFCLIGTIGQIAHTYYLTNNISSLDGGWRVAQAVMLSIFISASLLYFVSIADNEQTKESKRIHLAVNIFMVIEILINFYYYSRHLLLDSQKVQIFDFVFAVLVSCLIPVTIKLYAGLIHAKDWLKEIEGLEGNKEIENQEIFDKEILDKLKEEWLTEAAKSINDQIMLSVHNELFDEDGNLNPEIAKTIIPKEQPIPEPFTNEQVEAIIKPMVEQFQEDIKSFKESNIGFNGGFSVTDSIEEGKQFTEKMESFFNLKFTEIKDKLNEEVVEIFEKNQKLFLNQFENKCTILLKEKINQIK